MPAVSDRATARPFDAFEVHKVAEYRTGYDDAYCEPIDSADDQERADEEASSQFWTVYGHRSFEPGEPAPDITGEASDDSGCWVNGVQVSRAYHDAYIAWLARVAEPEHTEGLGLTAIADLDSYEAAIDMAHALAAGRVPVEDYAGQEVKP